MLHNTQEFGEVDSGAMSKRWRSGGESANTDTEVDFTTWIKSLRAQRRKPTGRGGKAASSKIWTGLWAKFYISEASANKPFHIFSTLEQKTLLPCASKLFVFRRISSYRIRSLIYSIWGYVINRQSCHNTEWLGDESLTVLLPWHSQDCFHCFLPSACWERQQFRGGWRIRTC